MVAGADPRSASSWSRLEPSRRSATSRRSKAPCAPKSILVSATVTLCCRQTRSWFPTFPSKLCSCGREPKEPRTRALSLDQRLARARQRKRRLEPRAASMLEDRVRILTLDDFELRQDFHQGGRHFGIERLSRLF